jgi:MerR family transcriptional regulator/heat shock protein HspR
LKRIAELTAEGMNVEGIRRVMALEAEVERLRDEVDRLRLLAAHAINEHERRAHGEIVPLRQGVAVFGQVPSVLRRENRR